MILDETYYNPFSEWLNVGWALHNTEDDKNNILFWTWVKFSSKSEKFQWSDIPQWIVKWNHEMNDDGLTWRSIYYWCQIDFPEEYQIIRDTSIHNFVWSTLLSQGADTDIAMLAKHLFKDEFACVSLKGKEWYRFCGHRWEENEVGVNLRQKLSQDLNKLFVLATKEEKDKAADDQYTAG